MTSRQDSVRGAMRGNAQMLLHNFFTQTADHVRVFSIDPARQTTIIGDAGTKFSFQPFSFCDVGGNPIVSGDVQVYVREITRKSEMILCNRMATSEDRLLESAGQFSIFAFQNDLPVDLMAPVLVEMPVNPALSNTLAVRLFEGRFSTVLPYDAEKMFDWKLLKNRSVRLKKIFGKKYYRFEIEAFNWYACQFLYAKKPSARIMVSARWVSDVEDFDDQVAFLIFRDIQSVARMYYNKNRFTAFNIPAKLAAQVVIISLKDKVLYYGAYAIENISSQLAQVPIEPISEAQLLEALRRL